MFSLFFAFETAATAGGECGLLLVNDIDNAKQKLQ